MLWQADHAKGWGASSVHLAPIETTWPEDPNGPDELTADIPVVWPKTRTVPYHYRHPVPGRHIPYTDLDAPVRNRWLHITRKSINLTLDFSRTCAHTSLRTAPTPIRICFTKSSGLKKKKT